MSADTPIGTARIDVEVDTSQFDSAISAAKRSVADMSASAQQQYQQLAGAEKRRIDNLIKQADIVNLNKQQQIAYAAALRTEGPLLDEITKKLARNTAAIDKQGISLKQQQAAMRGVPAQMTDIFVSLQGGQQPMTVLLQQGGQLKDMFGGIAPAARALGAQLLALINPATIGAAALAALTVAWKEGADEQQAFNAALIKTGGYAGASTLQFKGLVEQLADLQSVTNGGAVEALTAVAASGRFASNEFLQVAEAAARMQATTGQSIEETISKFEQIAKSPVDALLKLNETEHFLTRQQLARVDALIAEGDETRAVTEATSIYKQHLNDVADAAEAARPRLASLWSDLRKETSAAWAEVKDFAEFLAATQEQFKKRSDWQTWGPWGGINYLRDMSRAEPANATTPVRVRMAGYYADESEIVDPEDVKAREAKKKAQEEWNRWTDQNLSKREKQQAEEAKIIAAAKVLGKSQADVDAEIAASRARFAESQRSSAGGSKGKDPVTALAERIKQQITLNTEQLQSEAKLTTSQRLRIQVEQELLNLGPKATAEQRAAINLQLKLLESSGALVAQREREAKAKEQLARLDAQIAVSEQNRLRGNALDLMGYGRGGDAVDMLRRQLDIQRDYEDGLKRIRDSGVAADTESWRQQEAALRASRDRMLDAEKDYQNQRLALMADWRVGANAALEDYLFSAADVASQSRDLFATAFGGAEDAIRQFTKTGKLEFSDLADSIIADLARIAAKQMITGLFGNALSGLFGGGVGGVQREAIPLTTNFTANANGAVYASPSLSAYSGGVYDSPQLFAFAKGAGVFGEAGPEAIMPLRRGSDGRLGVAASGAAGGLQVIVNNHAPAKVTTREQQGTGPNGEAVRQLIIEVVSDDLANGGKTAQAGLSRYDWPPRV